MKKKLLFIPILSGLSLLLLSGSSVSAQTIAAGGEAVYLGRIFNYNFKHFFYICLMNPQSIKLELISWVSKLKDKKLLGSLASIKDSTESGDWYEQLTPAQKKSLEKGIDDHKKGRTLSSKQFWERYGRQA